MFDSSRWLQKYTLAGEKNSNSPSHGHRRDRSFRYDRSQAGADGEFTIAAGKPLEMGDDMVDVVDMQPAHSDIIPHHVVVSDDLDHVPSTTTTTTTTTSTSTSTSSSSSATAATSTAATQSSTDTAAAAAAALASTGGDGGGGGTGGSGAPSDGKPPAAPAPEDDDVIYALQDGGTQPNTHAYDHSRTHAQDNRIYCVYRARARTHTAAAAPMAVWRKIGVGIRAQSLSVSKRIAYYVPLFRWLPSYSWKSARTPLEPLHRMIDRFIYQAY